MLLICLSFVLLRSPSIRSGRDDVGPNDIAINALQRQSVQVTQGQTVTVEPMTATVPDAFNLRLEVDNLGRQPLTLKETDIVAHLLKCHVSQIMCKDMVFAMDMSGTPLKVIVQGVEVAATTSSSTANSSSGNLLEYASMAKLAEDTNVDVYAHASSRLIKLEKAENKASPLLNPNWKFEDMGIGGLDNEFSAIFRRAFASRLFPPKVIAQLGIKHVKGMLLYGPPGTGKTLIARQIGKMLAGKEPKVVNGPEVLNKFVGQAEENIRKLFEDAEKDYAENKENAGLHIIIFDEIDAICKARGSVRSGTGVHDTMVNQLLTKIDGVDSPNNVLVIGMTNRKDMLDPALLRPGRLEVHVEISLPDEKGRVQIFTIHTKKMRENGFLGADVDLQRLAERTKNFSGAEIEGLVKSATSYALYGHVDVTKANVEAKKDLTNIRVNMSDFLAALEEVKPTFGVSEEEIKLLTGMEPINYGPDFGRIVDTVATLAKNLMSNPRTSVSTVLLEGSAGSGKTALAAHLALNSGFPFVKLIAPEMYIGLSETAKSAEMGQVFELAYKSPLSVILIDNIERLLEYVPIGPRFSNVVLQTLLVLLKRPHPHPERKLLVLATTSSFGALRDMQMKPAFNVIHNVPLLSKPDQVLAVFKALNVAGSRSELEAIAGACVLPIGIKQLLMVTEMAMDEKKVVTMNSFTQAMDDCGLVKFGQDISEVLG